VQQYGYEALVPWRYLQMANKLLAEFSVKTARLYQTSPDIIIPSWNFPEDNLMITPEEQNSRWTKQWHALESAKWQLNIHYSQTWRLLHNCPLQAWKPKGVLTMRKEATPLEQDLSDNEYEVLSDIDPSTISQNISSQIDPREKLWPRILH
jgi:hypothetical protein